ELPPRGPDAPPPRPTDLAAPTRRSPADLARPVRTSPSHPHRHAPTTRHFGPIAPCGSVRLQAAENHLAPASPAAWAEQVVPLAPVAPPETRPPSSAAPRQSATAATQHSAA